MIEGQETKVMSVRDAIIEAMSEEMRRDENVFLIGEDVGVYGGDFGTSVGMLEEFGSERVRDTPISENAISGLSGLVHDVVHHIHDEVHKGHVDDRTHPRQSSTDSTTRDSVLGDRRVTYTLATEFLQHTY